MKTVYLTTILSTLLTIGCMYNAKETNRSVNELNKSSESVQSNNNSWEVTAVKDKKIFFKNGKLLNTYLYDLKYIGQLSSYNKAPYIIMAGRSCENCDENISIYIHSPSDGEMKPHGKQIRYSHPGKELDAETNELIFESKMYFGNCLKKYPNSVIWTQKFLNDRDEWQKSIFIVQIDNDTLREINIKNTSILDEIKIGTACKEVEGVEMTGEM